MRNDCLERKKRLGDDFMNKLELDSLDEILKELSEFNEDVRGFYMCNDNLNMHNTVCDMRTDLISALEIVNDAENRMCH